MKTHQKNNEPNKRRKQQKQTETLRERVHRHINDINSKITDEDIKNVKMELEIRSEPPSTPASTEEQMKTQNSSSKKQKKGNETDSSTEPSHPDGV